MNEARWLTAPDPQAMLRELGERAGRRELRLFSCACCRRVWHLLTDERSRQAVEAVERIADRRRAELTLDAARAEADAAQFLLWQTEGAESPRWLASLLAMAAAEARRAEITGDNWNYSERMDVVVPRAEVAALMREVFGNPYRPVTAGPWRTAAVPLARAAYDERALPSGELDPVRLGVLADALEEAGCPDEVLAHLRGPGPHVRGCWAVDLVLGKR